MHQWNQEQQKKLKKQQQSNNEKKKKIHFNMYNTYALSREQKKMLP